MGFVDDIDLEGEISSVARDVQAIIDSHPSISLLLNAHKYEITSKNFDIIDEFAVFEDFKRLNSTCSTDPRMKSRRHCLAGCKTMSTALKLQDKIATLERSITQLSKL